MRPLRLEMEGFTTFRATTVVDFEGADLFAITGPTGSGKTSLLDAIVFALYGNVPRLADQRSVAPVVAQGMAEARISLEFTVGDEPFTATRIVRRTKGGGGTTAEARLESRGAVLAGTADEVTATVTQRLGLTYEHFTKCVMLPQGEFARFLHDKPAARQDLLVSLLDLGVYADMAERAGRRAAAAKAEAAVLEGRLEDLTAATPEAVAAAAARVEQFAVLVETLEAAGPVLVALDAEADAARADAARAEAEAALLATVAVPKGLTALHEQVLAATHAVDVATAALTAAEAALTTAEASLAAAPDRTVLTRWLDAHERSAALEERRVKAETVVAERTADEAAAVVAVATALAKLEAAKDAEERVGAAHRAHAVRADLTEGEPCPVCLHVVDAVPDVEAPPALSKTRTARDKAEREHRTATEAHAVAAQAVAVSASKLSDLERDLAEVTGALANAPSQTDVVGLLEAHDRALAAVDACRASHQQARQSHTAALVARDEAVDAEQSARDAFDETRDAVAELKPPARRRAAPLLDEWSALADWAGAHKAKAAERLAELTRVLDDIAERRAARLQELARQCLDADLSVAAGVEPIAAAREALGRAGAEHAALVARSSDAARLRDELAAVEGRGALARGLATHLDARHFEKWLLDEAMVTLAAGATEMLMGLSGEQYSLEVDAKNGSFVVVDHRNADERRSARTLSGGETFLASLALALALADRIATLAARGAARLESIFLDEGFGTLDPDTLDVVASAIEELGAGGRMVGVVSHVAELAERVPVRFDVRRAANASNVERIDR